MEPKYKLTDETKTLWDGTALYRIEALREGSWGPPGTLGGWVESEWNLSQEKDCWVYDNAKVFGNARVSDNALIYENAEVSGDALIYENAEVSGNAWVFENAQVFGNQKINGECHLNGTEKGQEFQVNNICICDAENPYLQKYHGCFWIVSAAYPGWVQAKHGDEEVAFRNEWLRKV